MPKPAMLRIGHERRVAGVEGRASEFRLLDAGLRTLGNGQRATGNERKATGNG
jgi:hypothetical protein